MASTARFVVALVAAVASGLVQAEMPDAATAIRPPEAQAAPGPLDAHATLQMLTEHRDGGVQRVVALRADDEGQVRRVRLHLRDIRDRFLLGDLSALAVRWSGVGPDVGSANPGALVVGYRDVPAGGELTFLARDAALVVALHGWFSAQASDPQANVVLAHRDGHEFPGQE